MQANSTTGRPNANPVVQGTPLTNVLINASSNQAIDAIVQSTLERFPSGLPRPENSANYAEWKRPIVFFGRIIDERSNAVPQAQIRFLWTDTSARGTSERTALSGLDGRFELTGATGRYLTVDVSKSGYYTSRTNQTLFDYSPKLAINYQRADPSNPVVFRLRKKGPGANLISSAHGVLPELEIRGPRDGPPIHINLMNPAMSSDWQMEISQIKPQYEHWKEATEWSFRMEIPQGGFIEHDDEFPFEAPEHGYRPVLEFHFKVGRANWSTQLRRKFYIAFGQPRRFGQLSVETGIAWGGARLIYVVNPDGSRYLEPDENTFKSLRFYRP